MTKAELDRVVLAAYQDYPEMNEDLRSDVIVWLLEKGESYPASTSIDYLVGAAREDIASRVAVSQDAVDVLTKKEAARYRGRVLDDFYNHTHNESVEPSNEDIENDG